MEDELALLDDDPALLQEALYILSFGSRALFNALIYFSALLIFDVSIVKAAIVALTVAVFRLASYGARWIEKIGFALIVVAGAVWVGIAPPAKDWRVIGVSVIHQIVTQAKDVSQPHAS